MTLHVAIIMDGNGRWASRRGWPRAAGHRAGADAVRRTIESAPGLGIEVLTLFAFSADNWTRPADEVATLMRLFASSLVRETVRCVEAGVRLAVVGRRDRLSARLRAAILSAETATAAGTKLWLRLAIDYSGRDAIAAAARDAGGGVSRDHLSARLGPEVDLLVRTGGEKRLSDFLLWECAYAELVFLDRMWPEFRADDLAHAVEEFRRRHRRFGGLKTETKTA